MTSQLRTAFVPAGGGSLGALQVGMLAEILEAGEERPDLIVGASAGAINGAFLAHSVSITRARISTRAWIRDGGLSRAEFPGPLNIHTH